jgi:hypothetical protein
LREGVDEWGGISDDEETWVHVFGFLKLGEGYDDAGGEGVCEVREGRGA